VAASGLLGLFLCIVCGPAKIKIKIKIKNII
jgi:hypothetical protein